MPKTYQAPDPEHPQGEPHQRKKVGVYDRPERTGRSRGITLAIAAMVALLIILLLYMLFGGEDVQGAVNQLYSAGIETYRTR